MAKAKRASYRAGVEWIGWNDESCETDVEVVADLISVVLLADLFGKHPREVARDVLRWRRRNRKDLGWAEN